MSIIEIIVYLVLAIFIFSRLYSALGKETDIKFNYSTKEGEKIEEKIAEKIPVKPSLNSINYVISKKEEMLKVLEKAIEANPDFSIEKFMEGAEKAFETILIAVKKKDIKTLENLLDINLAKELINNIKESGLTKRSDNRSLILINNKKLEDLQIINNQIYATISFRSTQMLTDSDNKSTEEKVEDNWVFKKSLYSTDMKWLLSKIIINSDN